MTPTVPAYALAVLRAYLLGVGIVAAQVGERVFGEDLPREEADAMPRAAVVVKSAGGSGLEDGSFADLTRYAVDVWSYGATPTGAHTVRRAAFGALKALDRAVVALGDGSSVLLHSATRTVGPRVILDPETKWPAVIESFDLLASDVEITAA